MNLSSAQPMASKALTLMAANRICCNQRTSSVRESTTMTFGWTDPSQIASHKLLSSLQYCTFQVLKPAPDPKLCTPLLHFPPPPLLSLVPPLLSGMPPPRWVEHRVCPLHLRPALQRPEIQGHCSNHEHNRPALRQCSAIQDENVLPEQAKHVPPATMPWLLWQRNTAKAQTKAKPRRSR